MDIILQIYLEHKDDVIRNIEISTNKSLRELHFEIIRSLELSENEIASFYLTDENFNLVQEIPLFKIDDKQEDLIEMNEIKIGSVFTNINCQLIYVYDFMKMWRFLVSYIADSETENNKNQIVNQVGKMPKEATEIIFESDNDLNESFDELDEEEY
tara:strand:+ start:482 stop:949 length:468 start_codon:yes stop_codon:yes gene_type:complete